MKYFWSRDVIFLLSKMKDRGALPQNIEFSKIGGWYFSNVFSFKGDHVISENVQTGVDKNIEIAFLKSLSEFVERKAFREWISGHDRYKKFGTDGFAAFPKIVEGSEKLARRIALCEAIERYYWAQWWDIGGGGCREPKKTELNAVKDLIRDMDKNTPIKKIWELKHIEKQYDIEIAIYFCELKNGGYISGGASGTVNCETVKARAFSEMFRHSLALAKINVQGNISKNFYEDRLVYFGNGDGDHLVKPRLKKLEKPHIRFSLLEANTLIPHSLDKLFDVYKCHFENQPVFIGGPIERLCL